MSTTESTTIYAVIKGGSPFYRRSYSVEQFEVFSDLHRPGKLYRLTSTGPVFYDSIAEAELEILGSCDRFSCSGISRDFSEAWAIACRLNDLHGLPRGRESAYC